MRTKRDIPFDFSANGFQAALVKMQASIDNKKGKLVEIKAGKAGGFDIGIIVVEEDI